MILNLFKYFSPKYQESYNLSFYEKGALYFQQPSNFNDPWDCRAPWINMPRQIESLKKFHLFLSEGYDSKIVNQKWEENRSLSRSQIKTKYKDIFEKSLEATRKKIGVFSLSFIPDNELLWAHYSKNHTGYMLHIEISTEEYISNPKIQNIGIPIVVEYKKKRPKWDLISYISKPNEHIHDLIRFKSEAWIYEYELRLLNDKKYGFIEMPETWIKSIIVGLAAEEELKNELIKIGKKINRPVFFAEMDRYEFKVKIPGLTFNSISGIENYNKFRSSYKKLMSV